MLETLKAMILDSQETPLETGVPRRLMMKTVPGKAAIYIGVRRSGKIDLFILNHAASPGQQGIASEYPLSELLR